MSTKHLCCYILLLTSFPVPRFPDEGRSLSEAVCSLWHADRLLLEVHQGWQIPEIRLHWLQVWRRSSGGPEPLQQELHRHLQSHCELIFKNAFFWFRVKLIIGDLSSLTDEQLVPKKVWILSSLQQNSKAWCQALLLVSQAGSWYRWSVFCAMTVISGTAVSGFELWSSELVNLSSFFFIYLKWFIILYEAERYLWYAGEVAWLFSWALFRLFIFKDLIYSSQVELCKSFGDPSKPKAWSKHSQKVPASEKQPEKAVTSAAPAGTKKVSLAFFFPWKSDVWRWLGREGDSRVWGKGDWVAGRADGSGIFCLRTYVPSTLRLPEKWYCLCF